MATRRGERVDEGRKRVLLIAAAILATRKLCQYEAGARVPATISAIADAVPWANQILQEIDRHWPTRKRSRIHEEHGQRARLVFV
jgi:transposase